MYRQKGSITIFSLLSMLLVMSTLFSILELTRYQEIKKLADLQTETTLESAFAKYSSILWEQYHLLACNEDQLQKTIACAGDGRLEGWGNRSNLLLFQNKKAEVTACMRLTDGNGAAYMQSISSYMEKNILYETAVQIYNLYEAVVELKETTEIDLGSIDKALEEIKKEEEKQKEETSSGNSVGTSKKQGETEVNPLEEFQKLQKMGVLELVLEDTDALSTAEIALEDVVSHRKRKEGTMDVNLEEADWLDRVYLQQYLLTYLSHYGEKKEGHHLTYELEYLIGGKENDVENLKATVMELLALRAICNFLYLVSDTEKVEEARLMAVALVGIHMNPVLIEVVKTALLTAWAFGESILDVRALLQNKKLPLIKNKELWTLELENIDSLLDGDWVAEESDSGLRYENYLGLLLCFSTKEELTMRSMDVQEATLRNQYEDFTFCMDELLVRAEAAITYGYEPIFFDVEEVSTTGNWKYEVLCQKEYGYQ